MKSAYIVLGIPANAGETDIEQAYARAQAYYTPERLAADSDAVDRLNEARTAWQVLRDPQTRAAHDRKIASAAALAARAAPARATVFDEAPATSALMRFLWSGVAIVVMLFALGGYVSMRNSERRAEAAAAERSAAEARAREEKERVAAAERDEERRRVDAARADADERRLRLTSQAIGAQQSYRSAQVEQAAANARRQELLQLESMRAQEERQRAYEAQRRIESDKARVRELCWRNYGRPDC